MKTAKDPLPKLTDADLEKLIREAMAPETEKANRLIAQAIHEIKNLRHRNEILEAKVSVMDLFSTVLYTAPHGGGGHPCAPDLVYELERHLRPQECVNECAPSPGYIGEVTFRHFPVKKSRPKAKKK